MLANAARQGEKLTAFFKDMQKTYPAIGDVRGMGVMARHRDRQAGHARARRRSGQGLRRPRRPSATPSSWAPAAWATASASCRRSMVTDADMEHAFGVFTEVAKVVF